MAKIKFNLNFGGEQIRTLDDLRDNFSIEDVLDVYNNGLLVKWLDVHNHKDELAKVNAIQTTDARGILTELIRIFGISDDPSEIQESLSVLDYLEERKKVHEDMKAHGIPDYEKVKKERDELARQIEEMKEAQETETSEPEKHEAICEEAPKPVKKSYDELVREIIDNHLDLHHIYDCLDAITEDYPDILSEKYSELFNRLYESRPHTIIPLFAHHGTRPYYTIDNSKLTDDVSGVNYCDSTGKETQIFDTRYSSGSFSTICPDTILEKIHFLSMLYELMRNTFQENENDEVITRKCPYIKIMKCKVYMKWSVVEAPSKNFMLFYRHCKEYCYSYFFDCANTYTHHLLGVKNHGSYIPVFLPILEGIDIKTSGVGGGNNIRFAYIEAR